MGSTYACLVGMTLIATACSVAGYIRASLFRSERDASIREHDEDRWSLKNRNETISVLEELVRNQDAEIAELKLRRCSKCGRFV